MCAVTVHLCIRAKNPITSEQVAYNHSSCAQIEGDAQCTIRLDAIDIS